MRRLGRADYAVRRVRQTSAMREPHVVAVNRDEMHRFSKATVDAISVVAGLGVVGDAHAGTLVQHRSRVRRDPNQVNLRQVHLIHSELFDEARAMGYELSPGDLGENVLTAGIDLLALPTGTVLRIGDAALRLTGLRNPCAQINAFLPGLLKVVLAKADGTPTDTPAPPTGPPDEGTTATAAAPAPMIRKAGVMSVVDVSGEIRPGQRIVVELPDEPHQPLQPV